jgi:8-oxo-dGTP pyrophosphatase MutT (NUDIX family)
MKLTKRHLISLIKEVLKETEYTNKGHWGKKASGVLLTTGERVLLLLRSEKVTEGRTWGIPGGAIDGRETPLNSAIRELKEECGLSLDKYDVIDKTIYQDDEDGFKYTTFIIKVTDEFESKPIILDWENDDYKWVDQDWLEDNTNQLHSGIMYTLEQKWNVIFDSRYL